ncbi:hypothetical protein SAMN04488570_2898 [Nocardioides scoriae]|uniref:Uncharacterized protein n=1 Tax=Nocardioides scoriae TaxID=642780 RepID=A0A1H1VQJ8_9ACTN|nr:hypothetical protein SAMN04488570_2898 [Nocardioides scoriae]
MPTTVSRWLPPRVSAPKVARPTPWAAPTLLLTWLLGSVVAHWVAGDLGYGRGAAAYLLGVVVLAALALELGLDHYVTLAFWGVLLAGAAAAPLVGEEVVDLLGRPLTLVLLALGLGAWAWRALPHLWPVTTVRREVGWWVGPGLALLLVSALGVGGAAVAPVVLLGLWLACVAVLWTTGVDRPR